MHVSRKLSCTCWHACLSAGPQLTAVCLTPSSFHQPIPPKLDKAAADAAEFKAGFDKLAVDVVEPNAQVGWVLPSCAADWLSLPMQGSWGAHHLDCCAQISTHGRKPHQLFKHSFFAVF